MKKVIVIGGGFAGSTAAKMLERAFDVTLFDTKTYFEFTPGILRTVLEPKHMQKIQSLHTRYLHKSTVITETVIAIDKTSVRTQAASYPYDYLIIASGSSYNPPIKESCIVIATRAQHLQEHHTNLERAKSVLIIGGGLVGVELAAEIIEHYPHKKVTIAHSGERLIERTGEKSIRYATEFLRKRGVTIRYGQRVTGGDKSGLTTQSGETLHADMAFMCTGIVPNYEFMKPYLADSLNERNFIMVNEALQVKGLPHIFAVGDVNDRIVEKTAQNSERQAQLAAANILALETGQPLKNYSSKPTPMVISLGKWHGIFTHKKLTLTGIIPGLLKSFIEKKEMLKYR